MKNYVNQPCPICKKMFNDSDDIVVCPVCGAPYHRSCYKTVGNCIYKDKHGTCEDYFHSHQEQNYTETYDDKVCPRCLNKNPKDALFCNKCGFSFSEKQGTIPFNSQNVDGIPFIFDPLAGINPSDKIDNIEISEIAAFTKVNTPYYITVFKRIKDLDKSRFSFSAFLFSGAWFLYRKMYKLGAIFTSLVFILMLSSTLIEYKFSSPILLKVLKDSGIGSISSLNQENYRKLFEQIASLSLPEHILLYAPHIIELFIFFIMLFSGFWANRIYLMYCLKKLKGIKNLKLTEIEYKNKINELGGVNVKIVTFILVCYIIIEYLPRFFIK